MYFTLKREMASLSILCGGYVAMWYVVFKRFFAAFHDELPSPCVWSPLCCTPTKRVFSVTLLLPCCISLSSFLSVSHARLRLPPPQLPPRCPIHLIILIVLLLLIIIFIILLPPQTHTHADRCYSLHILPNDLRLF